MKHGVIHKASPQSSHQNEVLFGLQFRPGNLLQTKQHLVGLFLFHPSPPGICNKVPFIQSFTVMLTGMISANFSAEDLGGQEFCNTSGLHAINISPCNLYTHPVTFLGGLSLHLNHLIG